MQKLEKMKNIEFGSSATDEQIQAYEKKLGINFPEEYKIFLKKYGFAQWFGHFICGISEDEEYDVYEATIYERENSYSSSFPKLAVSLDTDFILFCEPASNAGQIIRHPKPPGEGGTFFETFNDYINYKTSN